MQAFGSYLMHLVDVKLRSSTIGFARIFKGPNKDMRDSVVWSHWEAGPIGILFEPRASFCLLRTASCRLLHERGEAARSEAEDHAI